jgi:hypothetical protein
MLIGLVAADVRPDRRYSWRATLLGQFHRSVACALGAVYVQSGHRQQPGARRARLGAIHQTAGRSGRPASGRHARKLTTGNGVSSGRQAVRDNDIRELRRFVAQGLSVSAGQSGANRPGWTRWSACSESLALFWPDESGRDAAVLRPFTAQLIRRKLKWPFPAACVILLIIGVVGDLAAVGA